MSQQLSMQSDEHSAGWARVPWLSHANPSAAAAHVALTHASQSRCSPRYGWQQPSHTLHSAPLSTLGAHTCAASHCAAMQAPHARALRSAQQASHAVQKPLAGSAQRR